MNQWNNELEQLFGYYKQCMPDPEASPNFMPELWRRIESRQTLVLRVRRLTQVFVATAVAMCVLFAILLTGPGSDTTALNGSTYVDVLAEIHPAENLTPLGIRSETE